MGVMTRKYTTPMKIGVVTLESAWASPIHARYTGPSCAGHQQPAARQKAPASSAEHQAGRRGARRHQRDAGEHAERAPPA